MLANNRHLPDFSDSTHVLSEVWATELRMLETLERFSRVAPSEGIVILTAENSISVELLTDCLLRFVPSGTVPNISNLPMSTGHLGIFSLPVTLTQSLLLKLHNLSCEYS